MAVDRTRADFLFQAASRLTDPAERTAYLDRECAGDADLRARVETLLRAGQTTAPPEPGPEADDPDATAAPDAASTDSGPTADRLGRGECAGVVIAGRYTLEEPIGEGGMGSVWRARQTEPVKRAVAVKLIKAGMDSRQVLARFEAERQALAVMDHPNIAKVLDGGLHDGRPYFVMELVKGVPITEYCDARKSSPTERLELFVSVCQAIQHAHQKGIIHRDIKPSNVLVAVYDDRPVVKVIDFGVAKATGGALTERTLDTGVGGIVGTPQYMSPEQASLNNLDIDTRSDVYSLGVLLYELLTGSPPFTKRELERKGLMEVLRVVREEDPPRPSSRLSTADALPSISANRSTEPRRLTGLLRAELDWVVMKALEKDRGRRYETAAGFAADVQRYLGGEPVRAHPPSAAYRVRKFARRNRLQVAAAGLVLLALVAGMAGATWGLVEARRQEAEAKRQEGIARDAAAAEKAAHEQAQKRLRQIEKGNEVLASIFKDLDIDEVKRGTEPLEAVLAQRLVKAAEQLEGESVGDPLAVAEVQNQLGESLLSLGHPEAAIGLFVKARQTFTALKGADDPDTLTSMNNLAHAYREAGKLDLALPLFEETLKLCKARLGTDHPDTLVCMNDLALAYQDAGKLDLALPLFEETLKLRKARLGTDHLKTLNSMNSLAGSYWTAGKVDLALPLFEETLKLRKAKMGADHPLTLMSMNNLALAYHDTGKLDLALPLFEETLKLRKAKLGADHPQTLNSMNNLATTYRDAGRPDLALPLFEETLKLRKAKMGADHPLTLASMGSLATAYHNAGRLDLALPLHEETVKLMKAKLGVDHPYTLTSMGSLALAYEAAGKLDLALPLLEESLKRRKAKLGAGHPHTLASMNNLALAYQDSGKLDLAVPLFEENLKLREGKQGADHPDTLTSMHNLARAYIRAGRFRDAERTCRECLSIREKTQPDAWGTFDATSLLGGALLGQKKYADAEPLLRKGYEGMSARARTMPAPAKVRLAEALDRLIELYTATAKPDEVRKYKELRAKYPPSREKK